MRHVMLSEGDGMILTPTVIGDKPPDLYEIVVVAASGL